MRTIDVNTARKAKAIVSKLKEQGRTAFYEQFADYDGFFYVVFYSEI